MIGFILYIKPSKQCIMVKWFKYMHDFLVNTERVKNQHNTGHMVPNT